MEKRNYVTAGRTVETVDDMIDSATGLFGTSVEKKASAEAAELARKASEEDEEADRSG